MYASASSIGLIVVEVDAVEDLVGNAKIERSGDNVPQLIKTGTALERLCGTGWNCSCIELLADATCSDSIGNAVASVLQRVAASMELQKMRSHKGALVMGTRKGAFAEGPL